MTLLALPVSMAMADESPVEPLELYPDDFSDECDENALQVRVSIYGVRAQGIMKLELYNSDDGFLRKKGRMRSIRDAATREPQIMCINLPEPGTYAIAGYHDLDGDRKLDQKWDFTPKEPYGLSNNPVIEKRRLPKFEEAAFDVGLQGHNIDFILVDLQADKKQENDED